MVYFQAFTATAEAGGVGYDEGLRSTAENPKRLLSVLVQGVNVPHVGDMVQLWYEKEKIAEIPLRLFDNVVASNVVNMWALNKINEIEVGFDIPIGATVKIAVKSADSAETIVGAYRYEITT
ncbi:hypothetical protein ES708_18677 [subsurface metagenome]